MASRVGMAARQKEYQRNVKSNEAARLLGELMSLKPTDRHKVLVGTNEHEWLQLLMAAEREFGTAYGLWQDDALGFVTQALGENVWTKAKEILESVPSNTRTAVPSCFSSGKCVWENDTIQLADGSLAKAKDLVGTSFPMMGWAEDGTQTVRQAHAELNCVETVYRLTTASGREVYRNADHPFWHADKTISKRAGDQKGIVGIVPVPTGWRALKDLVKDDMVLVPERLDINPDGNLGADKAAMIGYLLGDGHTGNDIRFTHLPGEALNEWCGIVERLGGRASFAKTQRSRAFEVIARGPIRRPGEAHASNPILNFVREWGMDQGRATTKRFPDVAWRASNKDMAVLLGRLFSCDGWASMSTVPQRAPRVRTNSNGCTRIGVIGIGLANEGLIRDIQRAMLRFGIVGTVRRKKTKYKGEPYIYWDWTITSSEMIHRFVENFYVPDKQAHFEEVARHTLDRRHTYLWQNRNAPEGYRWEKIRSVEALPNPEQTVAIEVDVDHAWADLMVEHNTWTISRTVLWKAMVHPPETVKIITLAPIARQIETIIWPEIRNTHARNNLPGTVDMTQLKVPSKNGLEVKVAWGIAASPNNEHAVQGNHAPHFMLVVDEAGGLGHTVGGNLGAMLTGDDSRLVALGNPSADEEGTWFETLCRSEYTNTIRISAFDTPNMTGEKVGRCRSCPDGEEPHLLSKHLLQRQLMEEEIESHGGDESNWVRAKVHAEFVSGGSDQVIRSGWIDAAQTQDVPTDPEYFTIASLGLPEETSPAVVRQGAWVRLGIDVAADGGDEFSIARLVGDVPEIVHSSSGTANESAVGVANVCLNHILRAEQLARRIGCSARVEVKVDGIGIGWGVADLLAKWGDEGKHGARIVPVIVSEKPKREPDAATWRPVNQRAEMWLAMRSAVEPDRVTGETTLRLNWLDKKACGQLSTPKFAPNSAGMTAIEKKSSMKARGVRSPDRGEAVILALFQPSVKKRKGRILA